MAENDRPGRPKLQLVVDHEPVSGRALISLPSTLVARPPRQRGGFCRVRVSRQDVTKGVLAGRLQPAVDFWPLLHRTAPPVPMRTGEVNEGVCSLSDAHACFIGIKRPIGEQNDGAMVAAYVLKPTHFYRYERAPPVPSAMRCKLGDDVVFVAHVVLDEPGGSNASIGVLTHWSFVTADSGNPRLPHDYAERYSERCW